MDISGIMNSLGWAMTHSLWQGLVAVGAVIFFRSLTKESHAALRCAVQLACLVGLFFAFIFTFTYYHMSSLSGAASGVNVTDLSVFAPAADMAAGPSSSQAASGPGVFDLGRFVPLMGMIWCAGFILLMLRYGSALYLTQTLRRRGISAAPAQWTRRFQTLVLNSGIHRTITLHMSSRVNSPVTLGFFKPIVLVPTGFFTQIPADQIEAILLHEIAHIRRNDYLINLAQTAIRTVLFYHPAAHFISRLIDEDRERACDDFAVACTRDPHALARGLAALTLTTRPFAMAAAKSSSPLLARLDRLVSPEKSPRKAEQVITAVLGLTVATALYLSFSPLASAEHPHDPKADTGKRVLAGADSWDAPAFPDVPDAPDARDFPEIPDAPLPVDFHPHDDLAGAAETPLPPLPPMPEYFGLSEDDADRLEALTDRFEDQMDALEDQYDDILDPYEDRMEDAAENILDDPDTFAEVQRELSKALSKAQLKQNGFEREFSEELSEIMEQAFKHKEYFSSSEWQAYQREHAQIAREAVKHAEAAMRDAEHDMERGLRDMERALERAERDRERAMRDAEREAERIQRDAERAMRDEERALRDAERARRDEERSKRSNEYKESVLKQLRDDRLIPASATDAVIAYRGDAMYVNGNEVSKDKAEKYCKIHDKYGIRKSRNTTISISPNSLSIHSTDQAAAASPAPIVLASATDAPAELKTRFVHPAPQSRVSAAYGVTNKLIENHGGIDFAAPMGTPIVASADGKVVFADINGSWGNTVKIKHADGYVTIYAHMQDIDVSEGEAISQGETIGTVGSTGKSTGPHLHFEIRSAGKRVDPSTFVP